MDVEKPLSTAPSFIQTVLTQLTSLKIDLSENEVFLQNIALLNSAAKNDICSYADKMKLLLKNVKNTIDDIDVAFNDGYTSFLANFDRTNNVASDKVDHSVDSFNISKTGEISVKNRQIDNISKKVTEKSKGITSETKKDWVNKEEESLEDIIQPESKKIRCKPKGVIDVVETSQIENGETNTSESDDATEAVDKPEISAECEHFENNDEPQVEQSKDRTAKKRKEHNKKLAKSVITEHIEQHSSEPEIEKRSEEINDKQLPEETPINSSNDKSNIFEIEENVSANKDKSEKEETVKNDSDANKSSEDKIADSSNETLTSKPCDDPVLSIVKSDSEKDILNKPKIKTEPKFGLIKCIDISKLLDPKAVPPKTDESVILLTSSDSEGPVAPPRRRKDTRRKCDESSSEVTARKLPVRNVLSRKSKSKVEEFKRLRKRKISGSDSSSSSFKQRTHDRKHKSATSRLKTSSTSYDFTNDAKLKSECFVSLPVVPLDKLKERFFVEKENCEVERLTNMSSLKRNRDSNNTSPTLENKLKKAKKLTKHQTKTAINSDGLNSHDETDTDIPNGDGLAVVNEVAPIPDNLLASSDSEEFKASDDEKKRKKEERKQKGKEKTADDLNGSADEEDKKNSKWKNDKLLKANLGDDKSSDSAEEIDKFRKKKETINNDIESGSADDAVITKKRTTKKKLRRITRLLGSDMSSSDEENDRKKSSSDDDNYKEKRMSSDSSSDNTENKSSKKKPPRRRIQQLNDSEDDSDETKKNKQKKKDEDDATTRKKIRGVWNKDSLAETTKRAAKEEEDRKKRIAERQKLYNDIYDNSSKDENAKVEKVVLDFNEETKEELLSVHSDLVSKLKPHQAKGVQFMWTSCFESLEMSKKNEGSGCILAHCMGLGKTLQVIALIHTLVSHSEITNINTVLVVCPLSTVLNWVAEFKKWLDDVDGEQVNVFDLVSYKQNYERLHQLQDWMKFGGVMVMGYDMFRNLSNPKGKRTSKKLNNGFKKCLLEPGPDMVVCDEGHLLKNEKTGISIAMNRLKTKRRIVLTGTPLQNNLKEYFCMVQFVKPNLLGTYKEYLNRFVNPITNGQYTDSTDHDISIMRKRAHVLHKMLDGIVERRDYNVLAPFLPPKHEYVLFVTLTEVQSNLYAEYLTKFARNTSVKGTSYIFQDFQELQRICIHPRVLLDKSNKDKLRKELDDDSEGSLKDFIDDDDEKSTSESAASKSGSDSDKSVKQAVSKRRTRANPNAIEEEEDIAAVDDGPEEWWQKHCQDDAMDNIRHSSKLLLLFEVLHQCELIGDKVLIFSQSLYSLNLIEYFLAKIDEATQNGESCEMYGGYCGSWSAGIDYFRLDGTTSCENRATTCKTFNNPSNTRARLFLISTRAGGLGINLVAANRVIIFDVSWNPSYDVQSIYRVYRFGQTKPCYIYRFVTLGTMENKIYERQVTKQAISKRVIDEQQIDRHYNQTDLAELYAFNPIPDEERPTPLVPKDRLFADLLQTHEKNIFKYHEHNSLLENKTDEGLNEDERQAAWEEFENEKKAPKFNLMQTMVRNGMYETLRVIVQQDNSTWTPAQVNNFLPTIVQRISEQVSRGDYSMYRRVEEKHEMRVMEQRRLQFVYQQYMQQIRQSGNSMTPTEMAKLAQMIGSLNTPMSLPQPATSTSTSTVSFTEGAPPPTVGQVSNAPPTIVGDVIELHD